jgi:hypothetical protein
VVAITIIILNHTALVKMRKYKIASTILSRMKITFAYRPLLNSLEITTLKSKELSSKLTHEQNVEQRAILKEQFDKSIGKIQNINTKLDKLNQIKNNLRINFVRTDDETLYYLGR